MINNYTLQTHKNYKYQLLIIYTILYVISTLFFFGIWIAGLELTNLSFIETLSYMIANIPDVRLMYIVWIFVYAIFCVYSVIVSISIDMSVVHNRDADVHSKSVYCSMELKHPIYITTSMLYIPFTYLKVLGLFLLWNYIVDAHSSEHYVWTAIALISAVLCCMFLYIRRLCCRFYIHLHSWSSFIIGVNTLFVITQIVILCILAVSSSQLKGTYELVLSILIGIDPVFQVYDLYNNYICSKTNNKEVRYKLIKITRRKLSEIQPESIELEDSINIDEESTQYIKQHNT